MTRRCVWCGVTTGAFGAVDRFGRWWDDNDIENLNSDYGAYRFGEYPAVTFAEVEERRVNQAGDTLRLCDSCWRREYPRCVEWVAADAARARKIRRGQSVLPGVDG